MQTRVDYFLPRKYDVISQLRHSYAKDPLCVTRLNYNDKYWGSTYLIPLFKGTLSKSNKPEKKLFHD